MEMADSITDFLVNVTAGMDMTTGMDVTDSTMDMGTDTTMDMAGSTMDMAGSTMDHSTMDHSGMASGSEAMLMEDSFCMSHSGSNGMIMYMDGK